MQLPQWLTYNRKGQLEPITSNTITFSVGSGGRGLTVPYQEDQVARKVMKIISSCTTAQQLITANSLVDLFLDQFGATNFWTMIHQRFIEKSEELLAEESNEERREESNGYDYNYDYEGISHPYRLI